MKTWFGIAVFAFVFGGACMGEERAPHADAISCPTQLALTGGPYRVQCTIDFTSSEHDVTDVSYSASDSNGATWAQMNVATELAGVREGSAVFTIENATAPPLGPLTIKASVIEGYDVLESNQVTATVNVVSP